MAWEGPGDEPASGRRRTWRVVPVALALVVAGVVLVVAGPFEPPEPELEVGEDDGATEQAAPDDSDDGGDEGGHPTGGSDRRDGPDPREEPDDDARTVPLGEPLPDGPEFVLYALSFRDAERPLVVVEADSGEMRSHEVELNSIRAGPEHRLMATPDGVVVAGGGMAPVHVEARSGARTPLGEPDPPLGGDPRLLPSDDDLVWMTGPNGDAVGMALDGSGEAERIDLAGVQTLAVVDGAAVVATPGGVVLHEPDGPGRELGRGNVAGLSDELLGMVRCDGDLSCAVEVRSLGQGPGAGTSMPLRDPPNIAGQLHGRLAPDGGHLVLPTTTDGSHMGIEVLSVPEGEVVFEAPRRNMTLQVAWSPDGSWLLVPDEPGGAGVDAVRVDDGEHVRLQTDVDLGPLQVLAVGPQPP